MIPKTDHTTDPPEDGFKRTSSREKSQRLWFDRSRVRGSQQLEHSVTSGSHSFWCPCKRIYRRVKNRCIPGTVTTIRIL